MFNKKIVQKRRSAIVKQFFAFALLLCCFTALLLCMTGLSSAAGITVLPSSSRVSPGETFYIDIVAENIPSEGLGAVQFRLNVEAPGSVVKGVSDTSQTELNAISVAAPLIIGQPTSTRSGIGQFFLDAAGPHGILVMDNESFLNGSGLYTFAQTNGSIPTGGSGPVARFQFSVGQNVAAEKISITLTEVMLLGSGTEYALNSNKVVAIELRCLAQVPALIGLTQAEAQSALQTAGLVAGNIYELNNPSGTYALNKVLQQSIAAGTSALCETQVDLAINTAPSEVGNPAATDKTGDENGAVILSWNPSSSEDIAGYRIYLLNGTTSLLKEISNPSSSGAEISGLPIGQASQIKITAVDSFGNESPGVTALATAVDDVSPRVEISGVSEDAYYSAEILPSVSATDANLSSLEITLNGSPYNLLPISLDGDYALRVVAKDVSGNSTTKEVHFVVDMAAPVLTVSTLSDGSWTNNELLNVSGIVTDSSGIQQLSINGTVVAVNTDSSFSWLINLQDGPNTISVTAIDLAGNQTSDIRTVSLDINAPIITISTPADNIKTKLAVIGVTGTVDENSTVTIMTNGADPVPAVMDSYNFSLNITPDYGINTIEVTATDLAGNTSTAKRTVIFDDLNPSLSITDPLQDVKTKQSDMIIKGETADLTAVAVTVTIDGNIFIPTITDGKFEQAVTLTEEKIYQIYVTAVDEAGNETIVQRNVVFDITAPAVTMDPVGVLTNLDTVVLTGSMEDGAVVTVTCPDATVGTVAYPTSTTWLVEISNMQEGITTIAVTATDDAGNTSPSIFADIMVDMTPPVTTLTTGDPKHSGALLFVRGNTLFTLMASDILSGASITEYKIDNGIWILYTPFNIVSEGMHTIYYRSTDNAGNIEEAKTITVSVDNTPPVTTISVGEPKHSSSALFVRSNTTFTLSASETGSGLAATEISINSGLWKTTASVFTLAGEDVSADGPVTIAYRSTDHVGNTGASQSLDVVLDDAAPAVNAGFDINVYAETDGTKPVLLSGTVTDGAAYDPSPKINWFEGGQELGEGKDLTHVFNVGLHNLTLKAVDHLGNSATDEVTVTVMQRHVALTYTGEHQAQWSDNALLSVQISDVTAGQPPVPLAGYGSVTIRIMQGVYEKYRYALGATDAGGNAAATHLFADPLMPSGDNYSVVVEFNDPLGIYQYSQAEIPFAIYPENGALDYSGDQVITINDAGATLKATLDQETNEPNGQTIDFNNEANPVWGRFQFYKFNQTPGEDLPYYSTAPVRIFNSTMHPGVGVGEIFVPLTALGATEENYTLAVKLSDESFISSYPAEASFTVYKPDGSFFTGGGFIVDPDTGMQNNFSFTFRFNKKGKPQGNLVYIIRDEQTGTKVRFKSNMLDSAGILPGDPIGTPTAVAEGKCNVETYDLATDVYLDGTGNLSFRLFMEDRGTPGENQDTFRIELRYPDGVPYEPGHMDKKQYLQGGNIVIH